MHCCTRTVFVTHDPNRTSEYSVLCGLDVESNFVIYNQLSTIHGTRSSLLRRRDDLPIRSAFLLILVHVTPRQRDGVNIFDQLDLEYRKSVGPKRSLEPCKVVFPHPNEPVGAAEPSLQDRIF